MRRRRFPVVPASVVDLRRALSVAFMEEALRWLRLEGIGQLSTPR